MSYWPDSQYRQVSEDREAGLRFHLRLRWRDTRREWLGKWKSTKPASRARLTAAVLLFGSVVLALVAFATPSRNHLQRDVFNQNTRAHMWNIGDTVLLLEDGDLLVYEEPRSCFYAECRPGVARQVFSTVGIVRLNPDGSAGTDRCFSFNYEPNLGVWANSWRFLHLLPSSGDIVVAGPDSRMIDFGLEVVLADSCALTSDHPFAQRASESFRSAEGPVWTLSNGDLIVGNPNPCHLDPIFHQVPNRLVRINSDGALDTGSPFNQNLGSGLAHIRAYIPQVIAIGILEEDSLVIGGEFCGIDHYGCRADLTPIANLIRLLPDGRLDHQFMQNLGSGFQGPDGTFATAAVNAIEVLRDGRIAIGGRFVMFDGDASFPAGLIMLNSDGTLDERFNTVLGSGFEGNPKTTRQQSEYSRYAVPSIRSIVELNDGSLLIGGNFYSLNGDDSIPEGLVKLRPDGTPDSEFNSQLGAGLGPYVQSITQVSEEYVIVGRSDFGPQGDDGLSPRLIRIPLVPPEATLQNAIMNFGIWRIVGFTSSAGLFALSWFLFAKSRTGSKSPGPIPTPAEPESDE